MTNRPKSQETEMALIKQKLEDILAKISEIDKELKFQAIDVSAIALIRLEISTIRQDMVTKDQFWPIKVVVYGFIGMILTGAIGSILTLVYTGSQK